MERISILQIGGIFGVCSRKAPLLRSCFTRRRDWRVALARILGNGLTDSLVLILKRIEDSSKQDDRSWRVRERLLQRLFVRCLRLFGQVYFSLVTAFLVFDLHELIYRFVALCYVCIIFTPYVETRTLQLYVYIYTLIHSSFRVPAISHRFL